MTRPLLNKELLVHPLFDFTTKNNTVEDRLRHTGKPESVHPWRTAKCAWLCHFKKSLKYA